jgi:outer membrane protein assembly factor BamB
MTRLEFFAGVICAAALAGAGPAARAGLAEAAQAREILDAAGIRGGLVVHLGCGDGRLTAGLRANESYLVHGLDTDAANVAAAREHIRSLGLYGPVSAERWDGRRLPYADNTVNLIVAEAWPSDLPMGEAMRALAPLGVAMVKGADGKYARTVKPRPKDIDEWPQYLYDAGNNAVSRDEAVGPPRCLQWIGSPMWARHHDHVASMSALVSAGGRIFYIMDEGPKESILLPSRWSVIARDAFSGVILWKVPIDTWVTQLWPLKSGPNQVPRKLVTDGSRVYVTLGLDAPVSVLDAASGKVLATWKQTDEAEEMIISDGTVFVQSTKAANPWNEFSPKATDIWKNCRPAVGQWDKQPRTLQAIEAATGKTLWKRDATIAPLTLTADAGRLYYYDGNCVRALGRPDGADLWHSADVPCAKSLSPAYGPTLVAVDGVVLLSPERQKMYGFDAATGKTLWSSPHIPAGHTSPDDTLVIGGNVWCAWKDNAVARDIHTGEIKKQAPADAKAYWFHHRCHRAKATEKYFMLSMTGIEFIDTDTGHWVNNNWIRGGCLYGIMPANGLVYAPPHSCGCYLESKQFGFNAVSAAQPFLKDLASVSDEGRLEKGPAYGAAPAGMSATQDQDWPTYRHDAQRSGASPAPVGSDVKIKWQTALGGHLTSPTIAGGRVYVAEEDAHAVAALEAETGSVAWRFTAGGRVDSPPTIAGGMAIFGSADGWIYAVRAADGVLAWRFRAAPIDRRIVAFEQLESAWPVSGAVLVRDAQVYAVAGRSAFLDGGLRLLRLDAATGKKLSETVVDYGDPAKNAEVEAETRNCTDMRVALPDVLSCDGKNVYMRAQEFDLDGKLGRTTPLRADDQAGPGAHLFSRSGFLDDTWFSRSYWMYGRGYEGMPGHAAGFEQWPEPAWYCPSGRLLVFNADTIYGFGRKPQFQLNSAAYQYRFFAAARNVTEQAYKAAIEKMRKKGAGASWSDWQVRAKLDQSQLSAASCGWVLDDPAFRPRGMVLAGPTVFAAGPPATLDEVRAFRSLDDPATKKALSEQAQSLDGKRGATLAAFSAGDGKKLSELKLSAPPVWDGLAAANGRLYMATQDGKVICLGQ